MSPQGFPNRAVEAPAPGVKRGLRRSRGRDPCRVSTVTRRCSSRPINPDADLSGFTDAGIRLLDPALSELGHLEVSDGRAGETALVLGSFRRRTNGDWDFVLGGRGYTGGLEELVKDFGIDVE